jgi:hypothetical protein
MSDDNKGGVAGAIIGIVSAIGGLFTGSPSSQPTDTGGDYLQKQAREERGRQEREGSKSGGTKTSQG